MSVGSENGKAVGKGNGEHIIVLHAYECDTMKQNKAPTGIALWIAVDG